MSKSPSSKLSIENVLNLITLGFTCATVNKYDYIIRAYKQWESASNNIDSKKSIRAVPFAPFIRRRTEMIIIDDPLESKVSSFDMAKPGYDKTVYTTWLHGQLNSHDREVCIEEFIDGNGRVPSEAEIEAIMREQNDV